MRLGLGHADGFDLAQTRPSGGGLKISRTRNYPDLHARAIGTSSHRVVYCGVRRSCFIPQVRALLLAPVLPMCTVPLPYRPFSASTEVISFDRSRPATSSRSSSPCSTLPGTRRAQACTSKAERPRRKGREHDKDPHQPAQLRMARSQARVGRCPKQHERAKAGWQRPDNEPTGQVICRNPCHKAASAGQIAPAKAWPVGRMKAHLGDEKHQSPTENSHTTAPVVV